MNLWSRDPRLMLPGHAFRRYDLPAVGARARKPGTSPVKFGYRCECGERYTDPARGRYPSEGDARVLHRKHLRAKGARTR